MVLREVLPRPHQPLFGYLFNSYDAVGDRWPRPTVAEVYAHRRAVDEGMFALVASADDALAARSRNCGE